MQTAEVKDKEADGGGDAKRGENPKGEVETARGRLGEDSLPILRDEVIFDLLFCPLLRKLLFDGGSPLGAGLGGAYIQRRVFAHRAIELFGDGVHFVVGRFAVLGQNVIGREEEKRKGHKDGKDNHQNSFAIFAF